MTLGCEAPRPGGGASAALPADTAPRLAASISDTTPGAWYQNARVLDLTGDGQADSVQLTATGTRPDSLQLTLSILVDGEEKHREVWGSGYELALLDSASRTRPDVDSILRGQLDSVLASVIFRRLGDTGMRLMAEDSSALAGTEPRPTHGVSFAYGYETTVRLAWVDSRRRYVRLWSCC
jgi:hypothetical protein